MVPVWAGVGLLIQVLLGEWWACRHVDLGGQRSQAALWEHEPVSSKPWFCRENASLAFGPSLLCFCPAWLESNGQLTMD